MELEPLRGKYILAVSGGVDSMVLLDILSQKPALQLVVAHFNHGIRPDSAKDEALVKAVTKKYGLKLEVGVGNLGPTASEEKARSARYEFLEKVRKRHQAKAIITAHHQDDLIETAFINILRGTGRRGLTSIADNPQVVRPLLRVPKAVVLKYAKAHKLAWRDDETNLDIKYLRNYIRLKILPSLSDAKRKAILTNVEKVAKINPQVDSILATMSQNIIKRDEIDRRLFALLPAEVGFELVAYWLKQRSDTSFDRRTVEKLNQVLKTAKPGTSHDVNKNLRLVIGQTTAHFSNT